MNRRIRLTEGDLRRIVNRSVRSALYEMDDPTVSYHNNWDDEGTHYDQTIKIGLTQEDLDALNSKLLSMGDRYDEPLVFGKNHLKLSQLYALAELLNWKEYKRVKMDRNTTLLIVRI